MALILAAWLVIVAPSAAAPGPPPLPGHLGFEAGPNSPVTVGELPRAVAVGDLNGDQHADFATANGAADTVTPAYGNGFGGFTTGPPIDVGDDPYGIVVADLDGDGRGDIATADRGDDTVTVLIQDEGGEFQALEPIPSRGNSPVVIAAGRLDDNDSRDLVVTNRGEGGAGPINVAVLLRDGDTFSPPEGPPLAGIASNDLVLADFSGDGELDIATQGTFLRLGLGDGSFGPAHAVANTGDRRIVPGDIDGDDHLDLLASGQSVDDPMVLLGTGAGGFHIDEQELFADTNFRPVGFAIGRLNADLQGDLFGTLPRYGPTGVEGDGIARVFLGGDDGALSSIADGPWPVGPGASALAIADLNEDGRPDVLTANSAAPAVNTVSVLLNTTPWPATLPDNLGFPDREVDTVGAPQSLAVENTGGEVLRVTAADVGGDHPDDFLKTGDTCTGASVPPAGSCAIRLRFAPSATGARSATLRLRDNTVQGTHVSVLTGTGTAATGGGGTGPAGPAGAHRRDGRGRCAGRGGPAGAGGRDGAQGAQGATGPQGPPGRDATVRVQAEEVALGQGARDVHGALRVRAALQRPRTARPRQRRLRQHAPRRPPRPCLAARPADHPAAPRALPTAAHVHRPEGPGDDARAASDAALSSKRRPVTFSSGFRRVAPAADRLAHSQHRRPTHAASPAVSPRGPASMAPCTDYRGVDGVHRVGGGRSVRGAGAHRLRGRPELTGDGGHASQRDRSG